MNYNVTLKIMGSLNYYLSFEMIKNSGNLYLCQQENVKDILVKTNMLDAKHFFTPFATSIKLFKEDNENLIIQIYVGAY